MAYTPTTWVTGDTITATKLNKLETGLQSASPFIINEADGVLDKTWQEIYDAINSSIICVIINRYENSPQYGITMTYVTNVESDNGNYSVVVESPYALYIASSANGYPAFTD